LFISFCLNFDTLEELELELLVVNSRLTITGEKKKKKKKKQGREETPPLSKGGETLSEK